MHRIIDTFETAMSLPLRVTFDGKDYTYIVLTKGITKDTNQIKISVAGEEFTLLRSCQYEWYVEELTEETSLDY